MPSLNDNGSNQLQHDHAIDYISEHYHVQIAIIRTLYESELNELLLNARIKSFLTILTIRHVKEILYKNNYINPH